MKTKLLLLAIIYILSPISHAAASDISIYIDNVQLFPDSPLIIEQNRVLTPVRGIFEYMNSSVAWENGTVTITTPEMILTITIGSNELVCNGKVKFLDVPAKIVDDRSYIPIRAAAELMQYSVLWDSDKKRVDLYKDVSASSSEKYNYLYEYEVFTLVNDIRRSNDLTEFEWDSTLADTGRLHARDMYTRKFFDHINPDNKSPFDRMKENGITYMYAAENIAQGYTSPKDAVNSWMNSDSHRENILNPTLKKIGVGFYDNYWCQEFTD